MIFIYKGRGRGSSDFSWFIMFVMTTAWWRVPCRCRSVPTHRVACGMGCACGAQWYRHHAGPRPICLHPPRSQRRLPRRGRLQGYGQVLPELPHGWARWVADMVSALTGVVSGGPSAWGQGEWWAESFGYVSGVQDESMTDIVSNGLRGNWCEWWIWWSLGRGEWRVPGSSISSQHSCFLTASFALWKT